MIINFRNGGGGSPVPPTPTGYTLTVHNQGSNGAISVEVYGHGDPREIDSFNSSTWENLPEDLVTIYANDIYGYYPNGFEYSIDGGEWFELLPPVQLDMNTDRIVEFRGRESQDTKCTLVVHNMSSIEDAVVSCPYPYGDSTVFTRSEATFELNIGESATMYVQNHIGLYYTYDQYGDWNWVDGELTFTASDNDYNEVWIVEKNDDNFGLRLHYVDDGYGNGFNIDLDYGISRRIDGEHPEVLYTNLKSDFGSIFWNPDNGQSSILYAYEEPTENTEWEEMPSPFSIPEVYPEEYGTVTDVWIKNGESTPENPKFTFSSFVANDGVGELDIYGANEYKNPFSAVDLTFEGSEYCQIQNQGEIQWNKYTIGFDESGNPYPSEYVDGQINPLEVNGDHWYSFYNNGQQIEYGYMYELFVPENSVSYFNPNDGQYYYNDAVSVLVHIP